jgi:photosystem II stability/assembly factor-like uncharacterized protein
MRAVRIALATLACLLALLSSLTAQDDLRAPRLIVLPAGAGEAYAGQILDDQGGVLYTRKGLWFTSDLGKTWSQVRPPQSRFGAYSYGLRHFSDRRLGWLCPIDGLGCFVTSDGGATWRAIVTPGPPDVLIQDFFFLPDGKTGWAGGGVYRVADPGEDGPNFVVRRDGLTDPLMILEPAILLTHDGGQTWSRASVPRSDDWEIRSVTFPSSTTGFAVGDRVLYRSTDGGKSWVPATVAKGCLPRDFPQAYGNGGLVTSSSFLNEKVGWVNFGEGVVLRTTDGGRSLCKVGLPFPGQLMEIQFVSVKLGWGLPFSGGFLYRTRDSGASWERVQLPFQVGRVSVLKNGHAWITGPDDVYDVWLDTDHN